MNVLFFRTCLQPCEHFCQLCRVHHAATLTTICSFSAKCVAIGGKRVTQNVPSTKIPIDLQAIDNSLDLLKRASLQTSYSKQKCSLRTEFEKFWASLPNAKTILSASPTDITRFLVWKDRHGKTVVHNNGCPDSHLQSKT